jgi:hypothetical protein
MDLSLAGLFSGLPGEPAVTLALTICAHLALSASISLSRIIFSRGG